MKCVVYTVTVIPITPLMRRQLHIDDIGVITAVTRWCSVLVLSCEIKVLRTQLLSQRRQTPHAQEHDCGDSQAVVDCPNIVYENIRDSLFKHSILSIQTYRAVAVI